MKHNVCILFGLFFGTYLYANSSLASKDSTFSRSPIYFSSNDSSYLYRAKIDAYSYHFSGIMLIKKLAERSYRCIFTTETGFKLFDLSIDDSKAKVEYVMKEMNNAVFLKLIKTDILLMLQLKPDIKQEPIPIDSDARESDESMLYEIAKDVHYTYHHDHLYSITKGKINHISLEITFTDCTNDLKANRIIIQHKNIPVVVDLTGFYSLLDN